MGQNLVGSLVPNPAPIAQSQPINIPTSYLKPSNTISNGTKPINQMQQPKVSSAILAPRLSTTQSLQNNQKPQFLESTNSIDVEVL